MELGKYHPKVGDYFGPNSKRQSFIFVITAVGEEAVLVKAVKAVLPDGAVYEPRAMDQIEQIIHQSRLYEHFKLIPKEEYETLN